MKIKIKLLKVVRPLLLATWELGASFATLYIYTCYTVHGNLTFFIVLDGYLGGKNLSTRVRKEVFLRAGFKIYVISYGPWSGPCGPLLADSNNLLWLLLTLQVIYKELFFYKKQENFMTFVNNSILFTRTFLLRCYIW